MPEVPSPVIEEELAGIIKTLFAVSVPVVYVSTHLYQPLPSETDEAFAETKLPNALGPLITFPVESEIAAKAILALVALSLTINRIASYPNVLANTLNV